MKRQPKYAIIGYTSANFWLLLIPLLRGLYSNIRFDVARWLEGVRWDVLTVTVMICGAVIRWYFTTFDINDKYLCVSYGVLRRIKLSIPYKNVCAVTADETPVHHMFGVVRAYIDTDAPQDKRKSADISLILSKADRGRLFNAISSALSEESEKKGLNYTYKVSKTELIVFSLLFSSALSGTVLLITLLSRGTDILGQQLRVRFLEAVNGISDTVTGALNVIAKIPPAGMAVSVVIGVGFLISFGINVMRHLDFTASRKGQCIIISCGAGIKHTYCININKINMADLRQSLLMKLFGVTSVHVSCTGYGKRKNEIPVFIPVCALERLYSKEGEKASKAMEMLLPGFSRCDSFIGPKIGYISRFILIPSLLIFLVMGGGLCAVMMFPEWHSLIFFLTGICEIPAVWFLFVKACAYCTNGINIKKDSVCAVYSKGYGFHTVTVPRERVAEIRITQSIFQRMGHSCDVTVYTASEYTGSHRITGMPIAEIQELIRESF